MPRSKGRQRPGRPCGMWPPALGSGRALGSHSKISREPLTLTTWWPGQGLVGRLLWALCLVSQGAQDRGLRMVTLAEKLGAAGGEGRAGRETSRKAQVSSGTRGWRVGRAVPLRPRPEAGGLGALRWPQEMGGGRLQPPRPVCPVWGAWTLQPPSPLRPQTLLSVPPEGTNPTPSELPWAWPGLGQAVGTCPEPAGCSCTLGGRAGGAAVGGIWPCGVGGDTASLGCPGFRPAASPTPSGAELVHPYLSLGASRRASH